MDLLLIHYQITLLSYGFVETYIVSVESRLACLTFEKNRPERGGLCPDNPYDHALSSSYLELLKGWCFGLCYKVSLPWLSKHFVRQLTGTYHVGRRGRIT